MLDPGSQATILLTVSFPRDRKDTNPLGPVEWGRFAEWLRERSLLPEHLMTGQLETTLKGLNDRSIDIGRIEALLERGSAFALYMEKWLNAGIWVMTRADPAYPPLLKRRLGVVSPAVLFGSGNRTLLAKGGIAVVGSRNATADDLAYSRELGALAANSGHSIVSGGARGVDTAAMLGALEAEGTVVGVLGDSLLKTSTSATYRHHIQNNNLALISVTNPEAGFTTGTAMQRNKFIYCLADAAVVVHSGQSGGTWNGAQDNLKRKWVPLWVKETDDPAAGNHALLAHPAARPLPHDITGVSIPALLIPPRETSKAPRPALGDKVDTPPPAPAEPGSQEPTLYDHFLAKLHALCRPGPQTAAQLQQALDLQKSQLDAWLKRAVDEGHIDKTKKPVRYQLLPPPPKPDRTIQPSLFTD